jgi:hypothetical protein
MPVIMPYGIILIVGVVVQIGLRMFVPSPPPPGLRWVRMALALVMLVCAVMIWVDDLRDRRRVKAASAADAGTGARSAGPTT